MRGATGRHSEAHVRNSLLDHHARSPVCGCVVALQCPPAGSQREHDTQASSLCRSTVAKLEAALAAGSKPALSKPPKVQPRSKPSPAAATTGTERAVQCSDTQAPPEHVFRLQVRAICSALVCMRTWPALERWPQLALDSCTLYVDKRFEALYEQHARLQERVDSLQKQNSSLEEELERLHSLRRGPDADAATPDDLTAHPSRTLLTHNDGRDCDTAGADAHVASTAVSLAGAQPHACASGVPMLRCAVAWRAAVTAESK